MYTACVINLSLSLHTLYTVSLSEMWASLVHLYHQSVLDFGLRQCTVVAFQHTVCACVHVCVINLSLSLHTLYTVSLSEMWASLVHLYHQSVLDFGLRQCTVVAFQHTVCACVHVCVINLSLSLHTLYTVSLSEMWASLVHLYHQSVLDFGLRQCTVVAFQHTVCACVHVCVINLSLSLHTLYTVSLSEMWASLVHLYHQSVLDFGLRQCTVVAFQHTVCACVHVCVINLSFSLHTLYTVSLSEMWASLVHLYHQSVLDFGLRQCTVVAFQHTVCACVHVCVINLSLSLHTLYTVSLSEMWASLVHLYHKSVLDFGLRQCTVVAFQHTVCACVHVCVINLSFSLHTLYTVSLSEMWASLVHLYHQSVLDFGLRQCTVVAFQHTLCACVHVCVINLSLSLHTLYTVSLSEMWASLVHLYHQSVLDFGLRQCTVVAFQHTICACVHVCVINLSFSLHTLYTVSLSEMWASLIHLYHQSVLVMCVVLFLICMYVVSA